MSKIKETPNVSLTRFDHPAGVNLPDSEEQAADRFQINVVERGAFRLGHEGREWLLGSGCVFLSRPHDVYRYTHLPEVEPDACLSVNLSESLASQLGKNLSCLPLVPAITNRLRFLQSQLGTIVRDDIELRVETLACELVDAIAEAPTNKRHLYRAADVGFVGVGRPEIADQRPDLLFRVTRPWWIGNHLAVFGAGDQKVVAALRQVSRRKPPQTPATRKGPS